MLKGDLSLFSLGEIFQSLAVNNHTGTLKITSSDRTLKLVYFQQGEIAYFSDGAPSHRVPRIGEILVRMQAITGEQLEEALVEQRSSKRLLGEVLLAREMVKEEDLREALKTQTLEGLYDLFLLKEGTFEFQMNEVPDALKTGFLKRVPIALNTSSVILEGLRQADEWAVIQKTILSFDEIFKRVDVTEESPQDAAGLLLEMVDGVRPVKELFKTYPGSRFETCKKLCEFAQAAQIRLLTEEECAALAKERLESRQFGLAAAYLQFASQINPQRVRTYVDLGEALSSSYQETAAKLAYQNAIRLHYTNEDFQAVADLGERLLSRITFDEPDIERLFFSYVRLQNFKRAATTGNQLVALHQKHGKFEAAGIVMEVIAAMAPSDLNLKIQAATLFEKAGNAILATRQLEDVAATLEKEKKFRELVKILRLLSQMNPKRQDLKQKIATVQALLEKIAKRKRFRLTIAGVGSIALLVVAVIPLLYEIKARESYNHAQRLEQMAMLSMDFTRAKEAYVEIVRNYCFSFKVAEAQEALARISQVERTMVARMNEEVAARNEEHEAKMFAMKEELAAKLREASTAEKAGDLEGAHRICKRIVSDYAEIPATKNVLFPLKISSDPAGATVSVDGVEAGKTPLIYRYKPGATLNLTVARSSCETEQQSLEVGDQWEIFFKLKRRPLAAFSLVPAIQQPLVPCQQRIVLPSRDGNLYAIDPVVRTVVWQRAVGRFGDRVSNLESREDEVYLGTVTGEVTAIAAATGRSRWIARVSASVIAAPAASPDGKWVAVGTTAGLVHLISNESGTPVANFATENEVTARPLFFGDLLIAGSTDNRVYGFSVSRARLEHERELTGDIALDLSADGDAVLVVTSDGSVHRLNASSLDVLWSRSLGSAISTPPLPSAGGIHVGTAAGQIITLDRHTGETAWEASAGRGAATGMAVSPKCLYAVLDTGKVSAFALDSRKLAWEVQLDTPMTAPPLRIEGMLYLGGVSGKIQLLEVLE